MTDGMQAASQRNRVTTTPAGLHYTQCSSQHARHRPLAPYNLREQRGVGGKSGGETPGPIPNPAVKSTSVDGSAGATPCESRPLPTSSFLYISSSETPLTGVFRFHVGAPARVARNIASVFHRSPYPSSNSQHFAI